MIVMSRTNLILLLYSIIVNAIVSFTTGLPTDLQSTEITECYDDRDCQANAYCHEGRKCLCKNRFIAINSSKKTFICVNEASLIGDVCQYDIQCSAALGPHAECSGSNKTIPQYDIQCSAALGPHAECSGSNKTIPISFGKCQCKSGYHYRDGICYKNSRIGEICQVNDNCVISTPNLVAYCDERRCICPPFYHANNDGTDCLPSSDLSGPCKSDDDCITTNSRCLGVCQCHMGYVMNEKKTHCLIAADKLNAPCNENVQCSMFLHHSICDSITNRCNCSSGFHEVNGVCYKTARLLEPCNRKEECLINSGNQSRVQCYNKFCLCADNYENVNKSDCALPSQQISFAGNNSWQLQSSSLLLQLAIMFSLNRFLLEL